VLAGCALQHTPTAGRAGQPSATLAPSVYYEEGNLVFFAVNTGLERFDVDDELVALEIAIANKSKGRLTVTNEGVTLQGEGKSWPAASARESAGHKLRADFERRLQVVPFADAVRQRFPSYSVVSPNTGATPGDRTLARAVELPQQAVMIAQIWFPHPGGKLAGRTFEVWLDAPELPQPVFTTVRF
jgi:hypothetical protein